VVNITFDEACRDKEATGLEEYYFQTVLQAAVKFGDEGYDNVKFLVKKGAEANFQIPFDLLSSSHTAFNPEISYVKKLGYEKYFWSEEEFDERLRNATSQETDQQRDWAKDVVWVRTALTSAAELGDVPRRLYDYFSKTEQIRAYGA
jgi:hypothetical protein